MHRTIDDATARFLEVAIQDLQQQLSIAGSVDDMSIVEGPGEVSLVARLTVADRVVEVTGSGEGLVAAYADLRLNVAEPTLTAAFRELVGA